MAGSRWTKEMDAQLSEIYTSSGLVVAIQAMGKTRAAVKNRCRFLRLRRPSRNWLPSEDAIVREQYSNGVTAETIARLLGRGVAAVRRRAMILQVPHGTRWTDEEVEAVRSRYKTDGAKALAKELLGKDDNHSVWLVYRLAERLKVSVPLRHSPEVYQRVRELHSLGQTDSEIARSMRDYFPGRGQNDRERITAIRRRMKLPAIQLTYEQKKTNGQKGRIKQIESGENPRNKAFRQFAEKYGLPGDTPPRAVEILLALASGPKTRSELHQMTGKDPVSLWNAIGTSYLGGLFLRGLVAKTKLDGATNKGDRVMYMLTSQAMDLLAKGKNE